MTETAMSEIEAIRAVLRATIQRPRPPLAEMRAGYDAFGQASPMVEGVVVNQGALGGVPALTIAPPNVRSGALLYLHGGGYAIGSTTSHAPMAAQFAHASGLTTHVLDYRLAPENRFPCAVDDAVSAYRSLLAGARADQIVIAGDSAGGGLTVATALALKQKNLPQPAGLFCVSPWADLSQTGASYAMAAERDLIVSKDDLDHWASLYLAGASAADPLASPVWGDFSGLAPILIHVGGDEVLLSDSARLAEAAGIAGVEVDLHVAPEMPHVWHFMFAQLSAARAAIGEAGTWMRARVAA